MNFTDLKNMASKATEVVSNVVNKGNDAMGDVNKNQNIDNKQKDNEESEVTNEDINTYKQDIKNCFNEELTTYFSKKFEKGEKARKARINNSLVSPEEKLHIKLDSFLKDIIRKDDEDKIKITFKEKIIENLDNVDLPESEKDEEIKVNYPVVHNNKISVGNSDLSKQIKI